MRARTKIVAVLFGPGRRAGELVAPGDADCRWRAAAKLERATAVNDDALPPEVRAGAAGAGGVRAEPD